MNHSFTFVYNSFNEIPLSQFLDSIFSILLIFFQVHLKNVIFIFTFNFFKNIISLIRKFKKNNPTLAKIGAIASTYRITMRLYFSSIESRASRGGKIIKKKFFSSFVYVVGCQCILCVRLYSITLQSLSATLDVLKSSFCRMNV